MTDLSPAAQAVLDAYWDDAPLESGARCGLAAALRAAADQVVPEDYDCAVEDIGWYHAAEVRHAVIREQLLAIADELEAHG
jgi:hypothetical protein